MRKTPGAAETCRDIQKTILPRGGEPRKRSAEESKPKGPFRPGQAQSKIMQRLTQINARRPGLGMLVAKYATARTTGKREENRHKHGFDMRGFGMRKTQGTIFCHIRQKEKKTSC